MYIESYGDPYMSNVVFHISTRDKKFYLGVIEDYYVNVKKLPSFDAKKLSEKAYFKAIRGGTFDDANYTGNFNFFDERLSDFTSGYYTPTTQDRFRYEIYKKNGKITGDSSSVAKALDKVNKEVDEKLSVGKKEAEALIENLLSEYPHLRRADLTNTVYNYAVLSIKLTKVLDNGGALHSKLVKETIEAQCRLGAFLGINEEKKAQLSAQRNSRSIADLSVEFQQAVDEYPELQDRFRYQELMIFLEKLDRGEIDRNTFQHRLYADCTVEEAKQFVEERHARYN